MFPQVFPFPQTYPGQAATYVHDPATNCFMPTETYEDNIILGDIVYDFLAREMNETSGQCFQNFLRYPLLSEDTLVTLSPTSSSSGCIASPSTTNDLLFSMSPSLSPSQTSSSPERHQPFPTPKPSCRKATPVFNHIRRKWYCSVCDKNFRGRWECRRHIGAADRRAKCLACEADLVARADSLKRHFAKYCKGDVRNLRFEDAFIEV
ncbi:hypothetical protein BJ322DRAFT_149985 [Thelephora terrestris]|uniref:C2H2-type domain-containing protein n=1 Tax=Thelephora terrestris TaxID=56493 RepID=A0A9P6HDI9_9AGAM|nr:hypothetical protein BJ322DRAFT_149985 [Thelephora terrestris]